jgi:hypothetical protein
MARERQSRNGRLEDALATVLQTQASMQQNLSALQQTLTSFLAQMAELKADSDRRFARIEGILLDHTRILQEHSRILQEHGRILQALPYAILAKIGFKGTART